MRCCPTFQYPCMYGNRAQTDTVECTNYWRDNEPATATVAADTLYVGTCTAKANEIAAELALYRAQEETACDDECCYIAACITLDNPDDISNFVYWTIDKGVMVSADTFICVNILQKCPAPDADIRTIFQPSPDQFGDTPITLFNNGCLTLEAGRIYYIGFRVNVEPVVSTLTDPLRYTFGWDCDTNCAPPGRATEITSFPAGIALCNQDI